METYSIQKLGDQYVVLALGQPQLKFDSMATAQAIISEIAILASQPRLAWDDASHARRDVETKRVRSQPLRARLLAIIRKSNRGADSRLS